MRGFHIFPFAAAMTFLVIQGCGGGGGGGGGSAQTGVRILHAAIDTAPVDASTATDKQTTILQTARFAQNVPYVPLGKGPQSITLTISQRPGDIVGTVNFEVTSGERRSLLVIGGIGSLSREVHVLLDEKVKPAGGQAAVRAIHGVAGAAAITVLLDGQGLGSAIPYGEASTPELVSAGSHRISIQRLVDGKTVAAQTAVLESNKSYSILAAGDADYFVALPLLEE